MTNTKNLPEYLQRNGQFCLWKYEDTPGKSDKPRKIPYNPHYPWERAETDNPETFSDLNTAAAAQDDFNGLGIRVDGAISGIDIDNCVTDGKLSEMAQDIVHRMDCYTEYSPSGKGIRILFLAPGFSYDKGQYYIKKSDIGLEVYIAGMTNRYLTVTGNRICGGDLENRADRLSYILDKYMKRPADATNTPAAAPVEISLTDAELIEKAKAAKNGEEFNSLWNGNWQGRYPSQSEADQALCNILAFWTGRDAARIEDLFSASGLGQRDKWIKRKSYRDSTIRRAISSCHEIYTPQKQEASAKVCSGPTAPCEGALQESDGIKEGYEQKTLQNAKNGPVETSGGDLQKAPEQTQQKQPLDSVGLFDAFMAKVQTPAYKPLETGMQSFDRLLNGGIQRQALVILSAAPGTGKTTLAQQIFETMAAHGTDVVFLNLEMSREQLLARSLSRMIRRDGGSLSAGGILKGYAWTEDQRQAVAAAAARYRKEIAPRMHYNPDGCGTMLQSIIDTLNKAAEQAKSAGHPAPVCVLDYLHLVTMEKREEAQEIVKKTVAALKRWAIDNDTFVFAISATNRTANSSGRISLESGRDSSALEYTADIQLSLNYRALHEKDASAGDPDAMERLQKENPRKMLVQVLKNRMGESGGKLYLDFDAANSVFIPVDTQIQEPAYIKNGWTSISRMNDIEPF